MEMTKTTSLAGFKNASAVSFSIVLARVVEKLGFQVIFFWALKPASYYFSFFPPRSLWQPPKSRQVYLSECCPHKVMTCCSRLAWHTKSYYLIEQSDCGSIALKKHSEQMPIDLITVTSGYMTAHSHKLWFLEKKEKEGTKQIWIKAEIIEFDLHRVRIIRGETVITITSLSFELYRLQTQHIYRRL